LSINLDYGKPGCAPWVGLIADAFGNFYGTTRNELQGCSNPPLNCGEVFELTPGSGEKSIYKVIHKFGGGKAGSEPVFGLIFGEDGSLYGATRTEGAHSAGVFYKLIPSAGDKWSHHVLHQFKACTDGDMSEGLWARDAAGNLYGTADFGGSGDGTGAIPGPILDAAGNLYCVTPGGGAYGAGMVYEITP